jgi:hypothetical protein
MEYNTERPQMIISEYGRNIQKMIDHATSIEDKETRNKAAQSIITVMGQLNPHLRDVTDFTHKLWDHLFIISDFKLDVDSPYPKPSRESLSEKPEKVKYPEDNIRFKHYGKNIELLVNKAIEMEEGPDKTSLTETIANLMKKFYLTWNKDSVSDDVIIQHLNELSKRKLDLSNIRIASYSDLSIRQTGPSTGKKKKKPKPGIGQKPKRNIK